MKNLTPEMLLKAKECKTAEEIVTLAKENNIDCTIEQVQEYFNEINQTGEIADDELDNVAGGGCNVRGDIFQKAGYCCAVCSHTRFVLNSEEHFLSGVEWFLKCESCLKELDGVSHRDAGWENISR